MHEARLSAAMRAVELLNVDALLLMGLVNIRYLSGFTGSDGALILTACHRSLLCDSRYTIQAANEASLFHVSEYKIKAAGIAAALTVLGARRVAFDAEQVSVAFFNSLTAALPSIEFVPLSDQLDLIRSVKSPQEIDSIALSAGLASSAFRQLLPFVRPGVSERSLAFKLELIMRDMGADEKAFDFIVASGVRGALPHGRPTEKLIASGEMVTFDFGVRCNGYHSDETVTIAVGEPDGRLQEIYAVVKQAHDLALSAVKPGITCKELDAIARGHIENCGYGDYFGHGLGHGVGLEIHEKPTVSSRSSQSVEAGMIFTIEPGIYVAGLGGVRIEDLVEVTLDGCRLLSKVCKELIIC